MPPVATLPFIDSFDHYNSQGLKWSQGSGQASIDLSGTASRTGIGCLLLPSGSFGPLMIVPALARFVMGTAFYPGGLAAAPKSNIAQFITSGTSNSQVRLTSLPNMGIAIFNGNDPSPTLLGNTGAGVLAVNSYNYIEMDCQISHSSTVIVRVNNTVVLTLTGVDTQVGGSSPSADEWQLMGFGGGVTSRHDDVYILDPGMAAPGAAFLGPVKIYAQVPIANSSPLQFVPLSGTNFSEVNQVPPPGDSALVSSSTVGAIDQYTYPVLGITPPATIPSVQHSLNSRVDAGSHNLASDVAGVVTGSAALTSNYDMVVVPYPINPNTGVAWKLGDITTTPFGPKVTS